DLAIPLGGGSEVPDVEGDVERVLAHGCPPVLSAALRVGAAARDELPQAVDELAAAGGVEAVDPLAPVPLPDEQARVGEDLQLVRDGGPGEREARGALPDVQALAREGAGDVLAGLVP